MSAIEKVQEIQQHKPELTRPLYTIDADTVQARADARALDDALGTACLSAVNRHVAGEEQTAAEEKAWLTEITTFFVVVAGLLKVLQKEAGKPPEQQTHGQHLKDAKSILGDAERALNQVERALTGWERARSDIVRGLAAAQKGMQKHADQAVKTGTAAAKKDHQALVKSESALRVWASKQGQLIESARKQLRTRRHEAQAMRGLFSTIPDALGTPV